MIRNPAETFPPGLFVAEEMEARGWSLDDLHHALGNNPVTCCAVDMLIAVHDKNIFLDEHTAVALAKAFGDDDPQYWLNLDRTWRAG